MTTLPITTIRLTLVVFGCGFLAATVLLLTDMISLNLALVLLPVGASLLGLGLLRQMKTFGLIGMLLLGLWCGAVRANIVLPVINQTLEAQVGNEVTLGGVIAEEPDERDTSLRLTIELDDTNEKVLAVVPLGTPVAYGDAVVVTGQLDKPKNFLTDTGREFDYVHYLQVREIGYSLNRANILEVTPDGGLSVYRTLFNLKQKFVESLEQALPEPQASLAAGLVVGARRGLGEDWTKKFREAGIIHVVVLSGYNITIVAQSFLRVTSSFLPRTLSFGVAGSSIILFAMLVGGGPTVVRASIMTLLALIAHATGRRVEVGFALLLAGFLMVLHNPLIIVYDTGFQLSFLATVGLIYGSPLVAAYLTRLPERFGLREIASSTIATQIFVLPWLLYSIGELSLVALPVNLLVLPLVPLAMALVALSGGMGLVSYFLSLIFAAPTQIILSYVLVVVSWSTSIPGAALPIAVYPLWLAVVTYVLYGLVWYRAQNPSSTRQNPVKNLQ